jgi:HAMP domain-containing protein
MNTTSTSIQLSDRRRGASVFVRQVALYLVLILLVVGVAGRLFFNTARTHLEAEVGGKLESVARIATRHTPIERLALIRVGDDQSRMVLRLKQRLEEIREETGLLNLYVFRPDRTSLLDLDPTVAIGTVYDLPQLGGDGITSLRRMPSTHTLGHVTPSGAIRMSAFAAITDSAGTLAAIVGVDAGSAELEILERMRQRLYWIGAACAGLAFIAALLFARSITRPVRHIADVAERLGAGDYTARADVHTRDELEVLASAVNRMAEQVRQRDEALKEMAASVAHEVRNPLNSIKLLLALLAEDIDAGRQEARGETLQRPRPRMAGGG